MQRKLAICGGILRDLERVLVAYSGGVDSTFLLAQSVGTLGADNVLAVMGVSQVVPRREQDAGRRLAGQIGAEFLETRTCEMSDSNFTANPSNRCFFCKSDLFSRLKDIAARRGFKAVVSGANADDAGDFRPGLKAGKDLGVRDPLLEAGLTKDDVREASRAMGLETWDKPAMACLASRVPYGSRITPERLERIEHAEYVLKDLGFGQCRVRDHETLARIEVPAEMLGQALGDRDEIIRSLLALGYVYVTLDLEGFRSGAMNEALSAEQAPGMPGKSGVE